MTVTFFQLGYPLFLITSSFRRVSATYTETASDLRLSKSTIQSCPCCRLSETIFSFLSLLYLRCLGRSDPDGSTLQSSFRMLRSLSLPGLKRSLRLPEPFPETRPMSPLGGDTNVFSNPIADMHMNWSQFANQKKIQSKTNQVVARKSDAGCA